MKVSNAHGSLPSLHAARTPRAVYRMTRVLALILVLLPPLLLRVPWQQNVRGEGRVSAYAPLERRQAVQAPIGGRLTKLWVVEGSRVKAGDPIFEVSDNDPRLLQRIRDQLTAAKAKLAAAEAKVSSYDEKLEAYRDAQRLADESRAQAVRMAQQDVESKRQAQLAAKQKHATAQLNYKRREELRKEGLASERDWELAQLAVQNAAAELERAGAALKSSQSGLAARKADQGKVQAEFKVKIRAARALRQGAVGEVASAKANALGYEVRLARQQTQRVTAPVSGTVFRILAGREGNMVKAGDTVATLVPDTETMAAELWVDGNDMPLLSVGRKVRVQFEGWPAVQFAGWPSVAVGTFGGEVVLIDSTDDGRGRFRVLVRPDPEDLDWPSRRFLRQGVQARGWILLEEVSLGFELWRQINGFPPVISPDEPGGGVGPSKGAKAAKTEKTKEEK